MRINCCLPCLQMWIILKSGLVLCITFRLYTQPAGFILGSNGTVRRDKQSNRFSCFRRPFVSEVVWKNGNGGYYKGYGGCAPVSLSRLFFCLMFCENSRPEIAVSDGCLLFWDYLAVFCSSRTLSASRSMVFIPDSQSANSTLYLPPTMTVGVPSIL